jgi:hypothetical protein
MSGLSSAIQASVVQFVLPDARASDLNEYLSIRSRWIFDSRVDLGIPSFTAAPHGPENASSAVLECGFDFAFHGRQAPG